MNPMVYGVAAFAAVERERICWVSCAREIRCVSPKCLRTSCRQKESARDGWTDALSCSACER